MQTPDTEAKGLSDNSKFESQDRNPDTNQQIIIGMIIFFLGALWGGANAGEGMQAYDVFWPAVVMLTGAMITLLGTTFGTNHIHDRNTDLHDAIHKLTEQLNNMRAKLDGTDTESE